MQVEEVIQILEDRKTHQEKELVKAKKDASIYGGYEDCGSFYNDEVTRIRAIIQEIEFLIRRFKVD